MSTVTQGVQIRLSATGAADVTAAFGSVMRSASAMMGAVTAVAGFAGFSAAFASIMRTGVQFNATLEQAVLGIAAVQKQMNPERFRNFDDAITAASGAIELLKIKAKESPASFEELVQGFQAITGAASQAGIPMKRQIDLVVLMSQALAGLGIRSDQIVQESRALLTGTINEDAMAARILGITKKDIDGAKQAGTLFEFLTGRLSAFGEAGERSQRTFSTLASNIRDSLQQAAGEASKPFFEIAKEVMQSFNSIDWEGIGKRAGAFVQVVLEAWKEGRFTEIVSLTIHAGFDEGIAAAKTGMRSLIGWMSSPELWKTLAIGMVETMNGAIKAVTSMWEFGLIVPLAAGFDYLTDALAIGMEKAINYLAEGLENVINGASELFADVFGKDLGKVSLGRISGTVPPDWEASLQNSRKVISELSDSVGALLDKSTDGWRNALGIQKGWTDETGRTVSAWQKLNTLIDTVLNKNAASAPKALDDAGPSAQIARNADPLVVERGLKAQLLGLEQERQRIANDWTLTDVQKYRRTEAFLKMEIDGLKEVSTYLRAQAALANDEPSRQSLLSRADAFDRDIGQRTAQLGQRGPDPTSFAQQWEATLTGLQIQWGSWAQQTAKTFATVFNTAVSSISDGITGLIMGTKSWGQALVSIGNTIMTTVIQSIVEMGVRWVMTRGIVGAANILWSGKEALAAAPKAMMESISSYGVAALVGAAAFAGVMALAGGFADGGWITGPGGPRDDKVMARLSAGEFVVNASAAGRHAALLEAINAGEDTGSGSGYRQMPGGGSGGMSATVILVDDMKKAMRLQMEHPDGRAVIQRVVRDGRLNAGIAA
jgi:hypothetical protein